MVCEFEVAEQQLREALAAVELAKERGFTHSTAIMRLHSPPHDATTPGLGEKMLARFTQCVLKRTATHTYDAENINTLKDIKLVDGDVVFVDE
jgi:hypothetical protein